MDFVAIGALEGPAFDQAMQATAMGVSAGILAAGPDTPAMRGRVKALKEAGADVSAIALGEQARVDCDAITRHEGLLTRARLHAQFGRAGGGDKPRGRAAQARKLRRGAPPGQAGGA